MNVPNLPHAAWWRGRRVLVTGHTGFKGAWLSHLLARLGVELHGLALDPPTKPSMFETTQVSELLSSDLRVDISRFSDVAKALDFVKPEIVIHLAAQPLVSTSVSNPGPTFSTNVMGTVNLLEAIRQVGSVQIVLIVTTDKVYGANTEGTGHTEQAPLDGFADPYSASKACAELVAASYRKTFFSADTYPSPRLVTARAGNVIGGGDWALGRLVPDYLRAASAHETLQLRKLDATRPWQHVLEPIWGYVALVHALGTRSETLPSAWNFGPPLGSVASVREVVDTLNSLFGRDVDFRVDPDKGQHDADNIFLNSSQAQTLLGWRCQWSLTECLSRTIDWWRVWLEQGDLKAFTQIQIADYCSRVANP